MKPYLKTHEPAPLTAIIVNYNTGSMAVSCLRSLQREWAEYGGSPESLEVFVVDNASSKDQGQWLDCLADEGVRVLRAQENLGYARAVNWALSHSCLQGPVLFLNPDLFFLRGSLGTLMEYLGQHPSVGAVAPRTSVDEEAALLLPPTPLPTAGAEILSNLGRAVPVIARLLDRKQSREARRQWSATEPLTTQMLSGACILVRAESARRDGGLLDPAYPLYYEDADLCQRLGSQGLGLAWIPEARVVHHWSRSAGAGSAFEGEPRRRWKESRAVYMRRFAPAPLAWILQASEWLLSKVPARYLDRVGSKPTPLGEESGWISPVRLELPSDSEMFMEVSMTPQFSLSAGVKVPAGQASRAWEFPGPAWAWLFEGTYFIRACEAHSGRVLQTWVFRKASPARTDSLSIVRQFTTNLRRTA